MVSPHTLTTSLFTDMAIPSGSIDQQQRLAEDSLIDDVVIEQSEIIEGDGGRTIETGAYTLIEHTKGRLAPINNDPSAISVAEQSTSNKTSILYLPLASLVKEGHRVTISFARGGTRKLKVIAILPRRTFATLIKAVGEEVEI